MKVDFTPSAREQFLLALRRIRADKPSAASKFKRKAEDVLKRLEDFPESGHPIDEFPDSPFRQVIVKPYRFFYRVQKDVVWVVGVWHGAQLPDEP